ncbi:hypothetical protein K438DRAFT_1798017 [Mycena galopus ATCC 62051]|nr:hypothetical protein K438DRAFT_1798017 [Mycena galopus ATCC 62051]
MSRCLLQAPKAPSDALRREARRIFARLDLIIEFRPWLEYIKRTKHITAPFPLLWETFALGASLATLLDLLGSPSRDILVTIDPDKPDIDLGLPHREKYFTNFIQRVQLLELQQKLPFGAVLLVQDLFGGTLFGFSKVLKTVRRVLNALQDSYPGVFVLPKHAALLRAECIQELLDTEQAHIAALRMTGECAEMLSEGMRPLNRPLNLCLKCLIVNRPLLRRYHDRVLQRLEDASGNMALKENWERIFSFEAVERKNAVRAYQSICANYLDLADLLQGYLDDSQPLLASYAQILLDNVPVLLIRTSSYYALLKNILSVTSPAESSTYDALCNAVIHLQETSENLVRTMRSARIFKAFTWRADVDPSELGLLLLDDLLSVHVSGMHMPYSVFLFERMLLCCTEDFGGRQADGEPYEYPVRAWELGPVLQRSTPLNLVHAIPLPRMKALRLSDSTFELEWIDEANSPRTLEFYTTCAEQYDQWSSALEVFVPSVYIPDLSPDSGRSSLESADDRHGGILSGSSYNTQSPLHQQTAARFLPDLIEFPRPVFRPDHVVVADAIERGRTPPRIGIVRRDSTSSTNSKEGSRSGAIRTHLDPHVVTKRIWSFLTSLWNQDPSLRPAMPDVLAGVTQIRTDEHMKDEVSEPGSEDNSSSGEETSFEDCDDLQEISHPGFPGRDLKGRVKQDDPYPFAGGGNSNVYRGKLSRSDGTKIRVAIKMIRMSDDGSGQQEVMLRRLKREVDVWSQLKHKNILPFIGVCEDLAPLPVLISPFYKFGHIGKYLRKHPKVNRAKLSLGVGSGLQFLHDKKVVHGDLKVQNVLVDKHGVPCICDFGISKIVSLRGFTTSNVGTTPYMAPELFFVVDDYDSSSQESSAPCTSTSSDVYSFALLVLEILTAGPPKGRPTKPIVTRKILSDLRPKRADYDEKRVPQRTWSILDGCWSFEPHLRPTVSELLSGLTDSFASSMPMEASAAD